MYYCKTCEVLYESPRHDCPGRPTVVAPKKEEPKQKPRRAQSYDPNASERTKRWKEENRDKHKEYMRDYMRTYRKKKGNNDD